MKLIEQFAITKLEKCPNLVISATGDGIGVFACDARKSGDLPFLIIISGNSICTFEDWKVCPLNESPGLSSKS